MEGKIMLKRILVGTLVLVSLSTAFAMNCDLNTYEVAAERDYPLLVI